MLQGILSENGLCGFPVRLAASEYGASTRRAQVAGFFAVISSFQVSTVKLRGAPKLQFFVVASLAARSGCLCEYAPVPQDYCIFFHEKGALVPLDVVNVSSPSRWHGQAN